MMRSTFLLAFILGGCVLPEPETSTVESALGVCTDNPLMCSNSPAMLHYGMHELSLLGVPNGQRAFITPGADGLPELRKDGQSYRLDVDNGMIVGRAASGTSLTDAQTVGAELSLVDADTKEALFDLRIETFRKSAYTIGPVGSLYLYRISWHLPKEAPNSQQSACEPYVFPTYSKWDLLEGMQYGELLLFGGERIDAEHKTVSPDGADTTGWITMACAGSALAKLDLSGNTRHRQPNDWAGRQATLKLLVGDYCGKGLSFTKPGVPLVWRGPLTQYGGTPSGLEARWSKDGAGCLTTPRLVAHPELAFEGVDIAAAIANECSIPVCNNPNPNDLAGYRRISANYFPP
jgi:hypothetical protein